MQLPLSAVEANAIAKEYKNKHERVKMNMWWFFSLFNISFAFVFLMIYFGHGMICLNEELSDESAYFSTFLKFFDYRRGQVKSSLFIAGELFLFLIFLWLCMYCM